MSQLKFSDLIDAAVPLSHGEAVALTLAVADVMATQNLTEAPEEACILLNSTGQVSFETVREADEADGALNTGTLAALVRRLLQLDTRGPAERRKRVPAALLGALARAQTQIDLPRPSPAEFRAALGRFGAPDPTTLAAVFWRAARSTPRPATMLPPVKVESALAPKGPADRRHNVPPRSDLRRYLRETERELYEARNRPASSPRGAEAPAAAAAHVVESTAGPGYRGSRFWRLSAGIAATVIGGVLGIVMAFLLAGTVSRAPDQTLFDRPAPAARAAGEGTADAALPATLPPDGADRPIRSDRSVQPLLLAAAVGADVFSPSFAPRGRTILFHAGRDAAPLMRASLSDSGEVEVDRIETVLDDGAANYHVTMAPDGKQIAYDSDRDGVRGVYVARADGSRPRRISGEGYAAIPSWSPDGKRLAFVRAESGPTSVWNIWFADVASGRLRRVTSHSLGQPWGASWFPDGQRLAYSLEDRLMVADLRSGLARGYRSPKPNRQVRTPAVSPDGRRIVFQVKNDGVWLLDVEQARMRRILADETAEEFVWAPDGSSIAYHARRGGSYGLWRLALDRSGD